MTSTGDLFSTCSFSFFYLLMDFDEMLLNYVSKCVIRDKTISSSDTVFDCGVTFYIVEFCHVRLFFV